MPITGTNVLLIPRSPGMPEAHCLALEVAAEEVEAVLVAI